jgi:hypothetical protein
MVGNALRLGVGDADANWAGESLGTSVIEDTPVGPAPELGLIDGVGVVGVGRGPHAAIPTAAASSAAMR